MVTPLSKVCIASFRPSTMVMLGKTIALSSAAVISRGQRTRHSI
jgi:hypothetical protein